MYRDGIIFFTSKFDENSPIKETLHDIRGCTEVGVHIILNNLLYTILAVYNFYYNYFIYDIQIIGAPSKVFGKVPIFPMI